MKPQRKLAETLTPDGSRLSLFEHNGSYAIRMNGQGLMHSSATESELMLGETGTAHLLAKPTPRILIGGLGLGFTLKSVLERVSAAASVQVAELMPAVVEWNREFLQSLNGALLNDPRVLIREEDVVDLVLRTEPAAFDAILLDIDNGPSAMVQEDNSRLYDDVGLWSLAAALSPGGRAVIWSAGDDEAFLQRLRRAPFTVEVVRAKAYPGARRSGIVLYVADKKS